MRPIFLIAAVSCAFFIGSLGAQERPPAAPGEQAAVDAILSAGGSGRADEKGNIETVEIQNDKCTDAVVSTFRSLKHLQFASLGRSAVTDAGLKTLANCPKLSRIELGNTAVTDEGLKHLAPLKDISYLDLSGTKVSERGIGALGPLPKLWGLCLAGARIGDDGIELFPERFPNLEIVYLSKYQIESSSIQLRVDDQQRRQLEVTPNAIRRNVDVPTITDRGLAVLAKLPKLRVVAIENSAVTDDGLRLLAEKTSLESLHLSGTKVTDAGLVHLAKLTNLDWLTLEHTAVTDEGLRHLFGMQKLEAIYVEGSAVTEDGAERLRKAVPKIRHIFGYKVLRPRNEAAEQAAEREKESILEKLCEGEIAALEAGLKKYPDLFKERLQSHFKGSAPTKFHHNGCTALHIAVLRDDVPMARRLFELGATTDVADSFGYPPLYRAESAAMVDLLVKHGDVVRPKEPATDSALFHATKVEVAEALIRHGADVRRVGSYGDTALHEAISQDAFEVVKLLIANGADVNARPEYEIAHPGGTTSRHWADSPLAEAAERGNYAAAEYLLRHGARCSFDFTVLDTAVEELDAKWVRLLLDHGALVIRLEQPGALLFSAARNPHGADIIPLLLEAGVPINVRLPTDEPKPKVNPLEEQETDYRGWTPLHISAWEGNVAAVKALLAGGIDPEIRGVNGWTALRCAERVEPFAFDPIQGTDRDVREYNAGRKKEIDRRNEARKTIREALTTTKPKAGG